MAKIASLTGLLKQIGACAIMRVIGPSCYADAGLRLQIWKPRASCAAWFSLRPRGTKGLAWWNALVEVRVQAVRLKLRPWPVVRLMSAL